MRVALLQNFVAPYRVPLYERLRDRLTSLKIFVSTPMESDRDWKVEWGTLDVTVQKNVTLRQPVRDPSGFTRVVQVHIPWDTLPRLWRYRPDAVITVELGPRSLQVALYKLLFPSTRLLVWCKLSEHTESAWVAFVIYSAGLSSRERMASSLTVKAAHVISPVSACPTTASSVSISPLMSADSLVCGANASTRPARGFCVAGP